MQAGGDVDGALRLAEGLIRSPDGARNVEAYDLVVSCLEARGDHRGAFGMLKDSAAVVPSARRQRIVGEAAYRNGDIGTARDCYSRVAMATQGTIAAQPQDAIAHAQVLVDAGDCVAAEAVIAASAKAFPNDRMLAVAAPALGAQMQARNGDSTAASASLAFAREREILRRSSADFSTIVLAKAELMAGHEEAGLKRLESAVTDDHLNLRTRQLIGQTLHQTGHADQFARVVEAGIVAHHVAAAKALFRDGRADRALTTIEYALADYPDNCEVLLQVAQMRCLMLRDSKHLDTPAVERVRACLSRLDALMPGSDRVARLHAYYRETLAELEGVSRVPQ